MVFSMTFNKLSNYCTQGGNINYTLMLLESVVSLSLLDCNIA